MSINDRIGEIIRHYGLEQQEFAKSIEVTAATISKIVKGLSIPGGKILEQTLKKFPDISAEWLMRGDGNMLLNKSKSKSTKNDHPPITRTEYQDLLKDINELKKAIRRLDDQE